jgi:hypothetical protein
MLHELRLSFFNSRSMSGVKLPKLEEVGVECSLLVPVVLPCHPHPVSLATLTNFSTFQGWHHLLDLLEDTDKVCQVTI